MATLASSRARFAFIFSAFAVVALLLGAIALAASDGLRGNGSLWLASADGALEVTADDEGAVTTRIEHPPHGFHALVVDDQGGLLWALGRGELRQYTLNGELQQVIALPGPGQGLGEPPVAMAGDPGAVGVWVLQKRRLLHVGPEGQVLASTALPRGEGVAHALAAGRVEGQARVWVSTSRGVLSYDGSGALLDSRRMRRSPRALAWEPAEERLLMATRLWLLSHDPVSGDTRQLFFPGIEYLAADGSGGIWAGGGVHLLQLDSSLAITGYRFVLLDLLAPLLAMETVADKAGVWLLGSQRAVLIDADGERARVLTLPEQQHWRDLAVHVPAAVPPQLNVLAPPSGSWTNDPRPVFHLAWEAGSAEVAPETLSARVVDGGEALDIACETPVMDEALCRSDSPLDDGHWQFDFTVADEEGRTSAPAHLDLNIDTIPPGIPEDALIEVIVNDDGTVTVIGEAGAVEPGSEVTVTNTATGESVTVQADNEGAFSATLAGESGDPLEIVARDAAGNDSEALERAVSGPLPPDPAKVAPPVERGVATNVYDSTRFLYEGSNPVQQDVAPDAITPERAAVLRGRVLDADGGPLAGVTVSINHKPELGYTLSRADGRFDMAVNGGGPVVINYDKEGHLPAQRRVRPDWQGWAHADDVVLIELDPNVTSVAMGDSGIQVAAGSEVVDEDGARTAVVVFPAGTQASMVLPDGSEQPLDNINVRATEYTVGERGPERMPGELPPTSGYTYAVELSVDEAIAAGASRVNFDRTVPFYVDNFLDFPTGGIVPVGWYDRERAAWVPSDNGRVIEVLAVENGLAVLDVAGEGEPATAEELAELGIDEAELAVLGERYAPGDSLWRTPVEHFTPWDCNWPFGPPDDAEPHDENLDEIAEELEEQPECEGGSVVECQNQTLGESLAITGSAERLVYRSDRVPGRHSSRKLIIPLTGEVMPSSLRRVRLEIKVAGQQYIQEYEAQTNLVHEFVWDGRDAYRREVTGLQPVNIRIGYIYRGVYRQSVAGGAAFGRPGGLSISGSLTRREVTLWRKHKSGVGNVNSLNLNGWSLSSHHLYDPPRRSVNYGYGARQSAQGAANAMLSTVAGDGDTSFEGGGPALETSIAPFGLDFAADGTLYLADTTNNRIMQMSPEGVVETVAGSGESGFGGDGGDALNAKLASPRDVAVGPDGSLYITDWWNHRIRKVSPDGVIETIAGTGEKGFGGDGGPGTDALLDRPFGIDTGPDGTVYFGDTFNRRIRQITPDGRISTVAGTGVFGYGGDGGPAIEADLIVKFLSYGPDGSLYFSDDARVRRIRPDGIIETIAGNGDFLPPPPFDDVEGHNATDVMLGGILGLTVTPDGSVFTLEEIWPRIRRVTPEGIIVTVAGTGDVMGSFTPPVDGPARRQDLYNSLDVALSPDGALYFSSYTYIRKVENAYPGFSRTDYLVASDNGEELYRFNYAGRHLQTLDAVTGEVVREFEYDDQGRLVSIIEAGDAVTLLERDSTGTPSAIVAPDGQRTELVVDENDNLRSVINPAGEAYTFDYTAGGLLTQKTTPNGHAHIREYDDAGRLNRTLDPENGGWLLTREELETGYEAVLTSAEGRGTSYRVVRQDNGHRVRTNTYPDGTEATRVFRPDATQQLIARDGTVTELVHGPDPRFGMQSPVPERWTMMTPAERTLDVRTSRQSALEDSSDPLSVERLVETVTIGGSAWVTEHDVPAARITQATPEGRATVSELDSLRRPLRTQTANLAPWRFERDDRGRLRELRHGEQDSTRTTAFEYGEHGFLSQVTDPLGRTVRYEYDGAGRVTLQTLPGGAEIGFDWDADGNLRAIVPPGREAHLFEYTGVDLDDSYQPPALDGVDTITRYTWNRDRDLTGIERPDGLSIGFDYDEGGRLETRTTPRGTTSYTYGEDTGQLEAMVMADGASLHYTQDGPLLLAERWEGEIAGTVSRDYDNRLRLTELVVGDSLIGLDYDRDNLLVQAGALTLQRAPDTGLLSGTTLGAISTSKDYNAFVEPMEVTAAHGDDTLYHVEYERDDLGRITEKRETVGGQTVTEAYTYDARGRLETVTRNGAQVTYAYDANGNRLSRNTTAGTYDEQDRLLTWGDNSYEYTANGELLSKTGSEGVTEYDYDILGNLRSVTLPDSTEIDYLIDARNRRIGKQVDGELQWGLLYQDQLNPVARTDAEGNIDQVYVYGSKPHVPDYMHHNGETYRLITDHLGSVRLVVNADTGEVAQRIDYDEFGRVLNDTNPGFQPFGFAGGLYDPDTNLVRFGARDYDPETGRWTAKDPIGFGGGAPNLYEYAFNDPVGFIDASGEAAVSTGAAAACIAAFAADGASTVLQVRSLTKGIENIEREIAGLESQCPAGLQGSADKLDRINELRNEQSRLIGERIRALGVGSIRSMGIAFVCGVLIAAPI